jgi:hypothetical protein
LLELLRPLDRRGRRAAVARRVAAPRGHRHQAAGLQARARLPRAARAAGPAPVEHALVRKLTVIVDPGATLDKRRRIATLGERLRKNLAPLPPLGRGVYVVRGATGVRRTLRNRDAVIARLVERGLKASLRR